MTLSVVELGRPERAMMGLLQPPDSSVPTRQAAFILCRPLGVEAVRTSAMFRALSERLAREGCATLRFDYHGTGDSAGDEREQTMAAWVTDVLAAHDAVCRIVGHDNIHWFGAGLGGNLALKAAIRARLSPRRLVLWEPVTDGGELEARLLEGHRDEVAFGRELTWQEVRRRELEPEPSLPGWVLGFDYGQALVDEMRQIRGLPLSQAARRGIAVYCAISDAERDRLDVPDGDPVMQIESLSDASNWMTSRVTGQPLVPPGALRAVVSGLG